MTSDVCRSTQRSANRCGSTLRNSDFSAAGFGPKADSQSAGDVATRREVDRNDFTRLASTTKSAGSQVRSVLDA